MKFLQKNKRIIIGAVAGAIGGYLYYHFVGCGGGSCAITSSPINSTLYGAVVGGLLLNMLPEQKHKKNEA